MSPRHLSLRRAITAAIAIAIITPASSAYGQPEASRAISVRELPPFPSLDEEASVVDVAVVSAQLADDERVVGAAKREQSLGSVASAVTVITADQIRRFGYRNLAEALSAVAGIYITDDRSIERIGIRGVQLLGDANTRLLILVDGAPLNEPWSQYVDAGYAIPLHVDDVSRIEVIRGPVSSIYGTNAFLGIVNVVTRAADRAPALYGRTTIDSLGSSGGNAGFAAGGVNRQIRGAVSFVSSGGETIDYQPFAMAGASPSTSADDLQGLSGSLVASNEGLFAQARGVDRTRALPGAPFDSAIGDDGNRNRDRQAMAEVGYSRELSDQLTMTGRIYASRYQYRGELVYPDGELVAIGDSFWYGAELRGLLDLSSVMPADRTLELTSGLSTEIAETNSRSQLGASDTMTVEVDRQFSIQGLYSELYAAPTRWLALSAGLRFDRNSLFDDRVNPRLALFLDRESRYGGKLLYAEGFRNPSIFEAFFRDDRRFLPACAPDCQSAGTTLSPEEIASYEAVGWFRPTAGVKLRASVWRWDLTSLIERRRIFDPMSFSERLQYQNLAKLVSRGVELEATFRNADGWVAYGNATVSHVTRNQLDEPANAPLVVGKLGASSRLLLGARLSTDISLLGSRGTRDETVRADRWIGWNATLYWPDYRGFDLTLSVRNILGVRQQVPAQADYDRQGDISDGTPQTEILLVPGRGRELFARLGYKI